MSDIGIATGVLGAVGDLFSGFEAASADKAATTAYNLAANYAQQNAQVAQRSGVIQEQQTNRQVYQVASGQQAAEGASGTAAGGSNQYLARATQQQGGLQKAIIANNAAIQVQGFEAEAAADIGQGKQAAAQGASAKGGGILGALGSILSIF